MIRTPFDVFAILLGAGAVGLWFGDLLIAGAFFIGAGLVGTDMIRSWERKKIKRAMKGNDSR